MCQLLIIGLDSKADKKLTLIKKFWNGISEVLNLNHKAFNPRFCTKFFDKNDFTETV